MVQLLLLNLSTSSTTVHMFIYKLQTVCKTNFSGLDMAPHGNLHPSVLCMWQQNTFSDPWAPPGRHQGTNMPLFLVCHHLQYCCRRVADLLRVGYSWSELSKLATSLVCWINGKMGHTPRQQLRPQEGCRDVRRWEIIHYCMLSHQENIFTFFSHLK